MVLFSLITQRANELCATGQLTLPTACWYRSHCRPSAMPSLHPWTAAPKTTDALMPTPAPHMWHLRFRLWYDLPVVVIQGSISAKPVAPASDQGEASIGCAPGYGYSIELHDACGNQPSGAMPVSAWRGHRLLTRQCLFACVTHKLQQAGNGHLRAEVVVSMQAISEHTDRICCVFSDRTGLPARVVVSCMSDAIQGLVLTAGFWRVP